jgi:hypothetical protein
MTEHSKDADGFREEKKVILEILEAFVLYNGKPLTVEQLTEYFMGAWTPEDTDRLCSELAKYGFLQRMDKNDPTYNLSFEGLMHFISERQEKRSLS